MGTLKVTRVKVWGHAFFEEKTNTVTMGVSI